MQVQWWCAARNEVWTWQWQWYPGVWIAMALMAVTVWRRTRDSTTGRRVSAWLGLALLWLTLDWPVGPLGAGYLASVHAFQFVMLGMVVPPLLLYGLARGSGTADAVDARAADARAVGNPGALLRGLRNPVVAAVLFTAVMATTHVPGVVDSLMVSQVGSFSLDLVWLVSGLVFWRPVIAADASRTYFSPPMRMLYLFLGTQIHLLIAMWLLMADFPVYAVYELSPRVLPVSAVEDQQIAGGVMLLVAAPIVLVAISIIFFRWFGRAEAEAEAGVAR